MNYKINNNRKKKTSLLKLICCYWKRIHFGLVRTTALRIASYPHHTIVLHRVIIL